MLGFRRFFLSVCKRFIVLRNFLLTFCVRVMKFSCENCDGRRNWGNPSPGDKQRVAVRFQFELRFVWWLQFRRRRLQSDRPEAPVRPTARESRPSCNCLSVCRFVCLLCWLLTWSTDARGWPFYLVFVAALSFRFESENVFVFFFSLFVMSLLT